MEAERVLTFIFTVVSDFALVPSLTVTAKNRKHFEVFVGTSAILTVRFRKKKKDFFVDRSSPKKCSLSTTHVGSSRENILSYHTLI